nr:unnamed protein product [Callosobruchus chinensis]
MSMSQSPTAPLAGSNIAASPSQAAIDTQAQQIRQGRVTPVVLRDTTRWRTVNYSFISLCIKITRAIAVDAGIRIIPKTEDDYQENIPHHTFPLLSERNIHAVFRGIPVSTTEQEIKEKLEQKGYALHHIIRLKRNGGKPMPLVVVILPKTEKSQQVFNEHELLGLSIRVEVQKNFRLIGQCHRCQKYGQWTCSVVLYRFTKVFEMCPGPHDTSVPSNRTRGTQMCELWWGSPGK